MIDFLNSFYQLFLFIIYIYLFRIFKVLESCGLILILLIREKGRVFVGGNTRISFKRLHSNFFVILYIKVK